MITDAHLEAVSALEALRSEAQRELLASVTQMSAFQDQSSGGIKRSLGSQKGASRTATAFSVFALVRSGLLGKAFGTDKLELLKKYVFETLYSKIKPLNADEPSAEADRMHVNGYSIPIWLTGTLSLARYSQDIEDQPIMSLDGLKPALDSIAQTIVRHGGYIPKVLSEQLDPIPSAYLTLWGTFALREAGALGLEIDDSQTALEKASQWSEGEIARLVACHHAAIPQRFDVVECLSAVSITLLHAKSRQLRTTDDAVELALHATTVALDSYFQEGSLRLSRPIFADNKHNTVLCSTSEALMLLLSSMGSELRDRLFTRERISLLAESFRWSCRNRRPDGFPTDYDSSLSGEPEVSAFSTSSTLAFISLFERQVDDAADQVARDALEIASGPTEKKTYGYPDVRLAEAVKKKVVEPLKGPVNKRAKHSMILHGPPGTAKTSIASQIAHDLGWPLKVITQSDFLKSGQDKIDAEAGKIFTLCLSLKSVVLLFDELEELILARDGASLLGGADRQPATTTQASRLLTTSMLPKIHELRDRKRIVFIFATNRLTEIDAAATRLGRFDIIKWVGYPPTKLLDENLVRTLESIFEDSNPAAKKLAESIAKNWKRLVSGEPLLTFVEMEYCGETLAHHAFEGRDEDTCSEKFKEALNGFTKRNGELLEKYSRAKDYDRLWL